VTSWDSQFDLFFGWRIDFQSGCPICMLKEIRSWDFAAKKVGRWQPSPRSLRRRRRLRRMKEVPVLKVNLENLARSAREILGAMHWLWQ
jgi:hypothetical protein